MHQTGAGRHARQAAPNAQRLPRHRSALVPTNCLKCASRQLQQLIRLPDVPFEELHRQQAQQQTWRPVFAADSSSTAGGDNLSYMQLSACSYQNNAARQPPTNSGVHQPTHLAMQDSQQSPPGSNSSCTNSDGSSRGGDAPLIVGMPPLASLLGSSDGLAGSHATPTSSQQPEATLPPPAAAGDDSMRPSSQQQQDRKQQQQQQEEDSPGVKAALAMLKWYKAALSPMMASTCRFLPTCSSYSMDSYKAYGVAKGTVLTAWRLLRCNPWGPSGYDPTTWPPPGLGWLFKFEGSAEVAVVVGTAAFVRFAHALLFE